MMAAVPAKKRGGRGTILAAIVIVGGLIVAVWWFSFGALSPCEAMRLQAQRIGEAKAGLLGKLAAGALTGLRADDFTPFECAVAAVKLKVRGAAALEEILLHGGGGSSH